MSRWYSSEIHNKVYEWQVTAGLSADLLWEYRSKKDFMKHFGHPPEEHYDYKFYIAFEPIEELDTEMSMQEKHHIRIDSIKIEFNNSSKTLISKRVLRARKTIKMDSLHVPPEVQVVKVSIYGTASSLRDEIESFQIDTLLKYGEKLEKKLKKYN